MADRKIIVGVECDVEITINNHGRDALERVIGPKGALWRAQLYDLRTEAEVLQHWSFNAVANGVRDVSQLDGWSNMEQGSVTFELKDVTPA